jgi:hypothetical protein
MRIYKMPDKFLKLSTYLHKILNMYLQLPHLGK